MTTSLFVKFLSLDLLASNAKELENDPHKVEVRMKQVQYGKNTIGYDNYLAAVPKYDCQILLNTYKFVNLTTMFPFLKNHIERSGRYDQNIL